MITIVTHYFEFCFCLGVPLAKPSRPESKETDAEIRLEDLSSKTARSERDKPGEPPPTHNYQFSAWVVLGVLVTTWKRGSQEGLGGKYVAIGTLRVRFKASAR
jgi:hypothetical protein